MSADITLNPGEVVIRNCEQVGYGGGMVKRNNDELILTNQRLILKEKSIFGKVKNVTSFPVSDIQISNNQAQVRVGKKGFMDHTLDVYFVSGKERFDFSWEDEIKEWCNDINTLLTGQQGMYKMNTGFEEMLDIVDRFDGSVRRIKKTFGIKSSEHMSGTCPSCGASIEGTEGETVQCPFCGSSFTFE